MSFGRTLARGIAYANREAKKEEERSRRWNELFNEATRNEEWFNSFLDKKGIRDHYVFDVSIVDAGKYAITSERRKLEQYKKKIEKYLQLGGDPYDIHRFEDIDDYMSDLIRFNKQNEYDDIF